MNAHASIRGGYCAIANGEDIEVVSLVDMSRVDPSSRHLVCGGLDDWEVVTGADRQTILIELKLKHVLMRACENIEFCLLDLSPELRMDLLREVEDALTVHGIQRQALGILLRAPLRIDSRLSETVKASLSAGCGATARLLERMRESQPQLQRVADRWLAISEEMFALRLGWRQEMWCLAANAGVILETLEASSFHQVEQAWVKLAFEVRTPAERVSVTRLSKVVAKILFPESASAAAREIHREPEEATKNIQSKPIPLDTREVFARVLKQVAAIASAVEAGHDARARQFLSELIESQISSNDEEHAVKSLCNLASQCAEMFRTDFEFECLQKAREVKSDDGWALVQLADHYKRVGRFDDAKDALRSATPFAEESIVKGSLADIHAQMGKFQEAIEIYDSIPGAHERISIRQGRADALRRWGRLDEAKREYERIAKDGLSSHRVISGQAEIAKRQGRLAEARALYAGLIQDDSIESSSLIIYRMALANVLVRLGDLQGAYMHLDDVVQKRPFARQPRAFRAAIEGLLGKPEQALATIPFIGKTSAFNEWLNDHVRGLLLLLLNRHEDARLALLQNVQANLLDGDSAAIRQLGAAVYYLQTRSGVDDAAKILSTVPEMKDAFADAIRGALSYHVAVTLRNQREIDDLEMQLDSVEDSDIRAIVQAIVQKNWQKAWYLEVRALLRLRLAA